MSNPPLISNPGAGGYLFASDIVSGTPDVYYPISKIAWGELEETYNITSMSEPLPVQPGTGTTFPISASALPLPTNAAQESGGNLATLAGAVISGKLQTNITNASLAVTGTFWQTTQPVSAVALPLPTGAATSALQATGNGYLSTLATNLPAQGQALAAASMPVVLTAAQLTALTPPAAITNYALETGGNLATLASTVSTGKVQIAGAVTQGSAPWSQNVTQIAGSSIATAASGIAKVGLTDGSGTALTSTGGALDVNLKTDGISDIAVNLAQVGGTSFSLGQQLAAASLPIVLTASQITTLTPPTTVTVQQSTAANLNATIVGTGTAGSPASGVVTIQGISGGTALPISGNITATDAPQFQTNSGTLTASSGAGSSLSVATKTYSMVSVQFSGTFTGITVAFKQSFDNGVTYQIAPLTLLSTAPSAPVSSAALTNSTLVTYQGNLEGATNFEVVCTAYTSGTVNVIINNTSNPVTYAENVAVTNTPTVVATQSTAANLLTTTYLNDGSGNAISSTGGALNVSLGSSSNTIGKVEITDGTNTANVAAANTPPSYAGAAEIIAISPNNTGIPANMPKIVQKTNNSSSGSVASLAKAFTSNNALGNTIIVVCAVGNTTAMTIADSNGNTYLTANGHAGTLSYAQIFYASNIAAGANTVTVTNNGATASMAMQIYEVSGLIQANYSALDGIGSGAATSTSASTGSIAPATANEFAVWGVTVGTAAQTITFTPGTVGWNNDSGQLNPSTPSGIYSFAAASAYLPSSASVTPAATIGGSEPWNSISATFRPVGFNVGGTVYARMQDGAGNALTSDSATINAARALDVNLVGLNGSTFTNNGAGLFTAAAYAGASGGWSYYFANAIKATVTAVSSAAGKLASLALMNVDSAPVYLQCFDTTGAVTLGSTTPSFVIPYPCNATSANGVADRINFGDVGIGITAGLKIAATTTSTGSTASANGLTGLIGYK